MNWAAFWPCFLFFPSISYGYLTKKKTYDGIFSRNEVSTSAEPPTKHNPAVAGTNNETNTEEQVASKEPTDSSTWRLKPPTFNLPGHGLSFSFRSQSSKVGKRSLLDRSSRLGNSFDLEHAVLLINQQLGIESFH